MKKIRLSLSARTKTIAALVALSPWLAYGQQTNPKPTSASTPPTEEEETIVLSPFEVQADSSKDGYVTHTTLAGNRLATDLKDLGTSLSVYNTQFMKDIGATDQKTLLQYTLGTEVSGILGNYSGSGGGISPDTSSAYKNPQSENRVRGLVGADNTRDLFLTNIPWDGYNIEAADIQRGPNAMLFGQGSAGGVINTRTKQANYRDFGEFSFRTDEYGSLRSSLDINRVLLKDELAFRLGLVESEARFQQKPAFENFNRQFLALRYEPKFLKKADARTIIKLNGEIGHSDSNRPRNMPPRDRITPWFDIGTPTYNVAWAHDNNWMNPGRGAATRQDGANPPNINPNYQPLIGGNGTGYPGGAVFQFEANNPNAVAATVISPNTYLGIGSDGKRDGSIWLPDGRGLGFPGYRDYASEKNLPFKDLAKDKFITDPSIFDFYNNLIDGNIKREWNDFKSFDASLSQTFFNDQVGFDIGYHKETYKDGANNPVDDTIKIDVNSQWGDGTNSPAGWNQDGTKNFGAGRPYVTFYERPTRNRSDRESTRATAFAMHDFAKDGSNWLLRLLGQHTVTGMASRDDASRYEQSWFKNSYIGDYYNHPMWEQLKQTNGRFVSDFLPQELMYIGPNLQGKTLGQDLGIRASSTAPTIGDKATIRYFDPTWNAPGVDPAAPWTNYMNVGSYSGSSTFQSTQSENPANYVGWGNREVSLISDTTEVNREYLTFSRKWDKRYNKTKAIVWQGKFWDNSIIATAGLRWDTVGQTVTNWDRTQATADPTQIPNVVANVGPYENKKSKSWGAVAHFDNLPFIGKWAKRLPVSISASFNRSENFQTGQVYTDYFGGQLPLPEGKTKYMGVIVATRDGKYSVRLNKFESSVKNNYSQILQFWNYGNNIGIYARAYHQQKYNYEASGNPNSPRHGNNIISDLPWPGPNEQSRKFDFDYNTFNGQTQAEAEAQEIATINAWDKWLADASPLPQLQAKANKFNWDGSDLQEGDNDFRFTEDILAKGHELELQAQITDSWRLTLNAARIKSYRDNIGKSPAPANNLGAATMIDYLLEFDHRLNTTALGDLRIWGANNPSTARENWNGYADGDIKARLAEQGTVVPENRLWHINLISNYDFKAGMLKGWSIGGAARYESAATLAYKPVQLPTNIAYDLNAPFRDQALLDFDAWVGYGRMINSKIFWRAQLNIANVGVGNELIPVTVQPNGDVAAWRIRPSQQISLTNTFSF